MTDTPGTVQGETGKPAGFGWGDAAELHKCADGGGLFHRFKTIRRGSFAELIRFVMDLPEDHQDEYAIQKEGDRLFKAGEIRTLSRRPDFPAPHG
ncbi:hypothetical protein ACFSTD_08405 [Novosphingobium colocasiae]|uniref:Uncharacterized protein n=1 Tax=Novosphingobium colocasiae TaxID=1256513 RepID=A0A918PE17_9SPHN|nr:hypothetical protein [Novosphingobium colocasiae]GGZ01108.1 hypothetical protein GCM10011614_14940 [Novosphingobium colocasiae]